MSKNVPSLIKIACDINLLDIKKTVSVVHILPTTKMTQDNYMDMCAFDANDYNHAITSYGCDICDARTSIENPIYTNSEYQGCDICEKCLLKAFNDDKFKEMPGWNPGPVYSLEDIYISVKGDSALDDKNDKNDDSDSSPRLIGL